MGTKSKKPKKRLTLAERKKKKQRLVVIIVTSVLSVLYLYVCFVALQYGYLSNKRNYEPGSDAYLRVMRASIGEKIGMAMENVFTHPGHVFPISGTTIVTLFAITLFLLAIVIPSIMISRLKKHDDDETVQGSAHWQTKEEKKDYDERLTFAGAHPSVSTPLPEETDDMILSSELRLSMNGYFTQINNNILIIGGSGTGKSRSFAGPNILQYNSNYVVTDPSAELYNAYAKGLEDHGYEIKAFNLTDAYKSHRYNPFHYIKVEKDVFTLVDTFIANTSGDQRGKGDPFWEKSENLLLTALILYLWHTADPADQTMSRVGELINLAQVAEDDPGKVDSPLDTLFQALEKEDPNNLAVSQYKKFKLGAGKTLKSILISVAVRMQAFALSDVAYLTSTDDFHFENFADKKSALFIITPTGDQTFNFLVAMMYTQLFSSLYYYGENEVFRGYACQMDNGDFVHVEHASDKQETKIAKEKCEDLLKSIKKELFIEEDADRHLFYVCTTHNGQKTRLGWRGQKADVEALKKKLQTTKVVSLKKQQNRVPYHVRFILDEFANIGKIPQFSEKLSTVRKYNVSASIIIQALSQLKSLYKDDHPTIISNCNTILFLGTSDTETCKWLSEKLGKKTTSVKSESFQAGRSGGSMSISHQSRDLMTVDELTQMPGNTCIVIVLREKPWIGPKYNLTDHPNYAYAAEHAEDYVPEINPDKSSLINIPLRERRKIGASAQNLAQTMDASSSSEKTSKERPEDRNKSSKTPELRSRTFNSPSKKDSVSSSTGTAIAMTARQASSFDDGDSAITPEEMAFLNSKFHQQTHSLARKKESKVVAEMSKSKPDTTEQGILDAYAQLGFTPMQSVEEISEKMESLLTFKPDNESYLYELKTK